MNEKNIVTQNNYENQNSNKVQIICNTQLIAIDINEYNFLKQENKDLKLRILEITKDKDFLQNTIHIKNETIEELKIENEKLKNRLDELEKKCDDQHITINELRKDIDELKKKVLKKFIRVLLY